MNRISRLAQVYKRHISAPWQETIAGAQRVVMIIYRREEERALRRRLDEFEQATRDAGRQWILVDATRWFAEWMAAHEYREAYFEDPELLEMSIDEDFRRETAAKLSAALESADDNTVIALCGASSLYGFLRISELLPLVEQSIRGRLVVFFPGSKNDNNYRLLDARDGWSYLAQAITLNDPWMPQEAL